MTLSTIEVVIDAKIEDVWQAITQLENVTWRSDISRIEVVSEGKEFVEYTTDCYATHFVITAFQPPSTYAFTMDNENMNGKWWGTLTEKGDQTQAVFTEDVSAKKLFLKPFVKLYLTKQQKQYMQDLKRHLET